MPKESLEELQYASYWDARYAAPPSDPDSLARREAADGQESYEWFRKFEHLKEFFERHLPAAETKSKILHLGCGNSVSQSPFSQSAGTR